MSTSASQQTENQNAGAQSDNSSRSKGFSIQINKDLLPFKLFFFTFFMAHVGVQSYKTLFYKQLHLSPFQTGILLGILPSTHLVFAPVLAYLADRLKKIKLFCLICTASFALMEFLSSQATRVNTHQQAINCSLSLNNSREIQIHHLEYNTGNLKAFTYLLVVTTLGGILTSAAVVTATTLTLQNLKGKYENFGYQYLYSSVGFLISTLIIGSLLNFDKEVQIRCEYGAIFSTNYSISLYVGSTFYFAAFIIAFFFKEYDTGPSLHTSTLKNLYKGLSMQLLIVLGTCLYGGLSYAIIQGLLFWHLKDLGGSQSLILLVTILNAVGQILGCLASRYMILKTGHMLVICASLAVYALRFLTYLLIQNPWVVLAVEFLDGISTSWIQIACTSYVGLVPGANTAAQSLVHVCFHGVGPALGFLLGGLLVSYVGYRMTFSIFACLSVVILLIFYLSNYFISQGSSPSDYSPLNTQSEEEGMEDTRQ